MDIKLIATDMDDTLLNEREEVSDRTAAAIRGAMAAGVNVVLATGRMFQSAKVFADALALDLPLITYNGALVRPRSGKALFARTIEQSAAAAVLALFKEQGWYVQTYIDDILYVKEYTDESAYYEKLTQVKARPVGDAVFKGTEGVLKILALTHDEELMAHIRAEVCRRFGQRLYVATSKSCYLEITHPAVNKGQALAFLAQHLGISAQEIMAVGDGANDIDMLRYAGLGVAMGNAKNVVQGAADAVTGTNREDGLAQAIERYVLRQG